jgi:hypothetical protein
MARCIRSRGSVLLMMLVLGTCDAAVGPTCVATKAPSAAAVAPTETTSGSGCATDWASIKPADSKEPIENPHRLGWQEWTVVASALGLLGVLTVVLVRFSRSRPSAR